MNYLGVLIAAAMLIILSACGSSASQATLSAPIVPTSPNAAYQTAFPVVGATDVTILAPEDDTTGGPAATQPTPDAAPVVTETVYEEETPSPETISVPGVRETATADETATPGQ